MWCQYARTTSESKPSREPVLLNRASSLIFPRRGITPDLLPTVDTGLDTRDTIEGGSNVETEDGAAVGERRSRVIIDDVSDLFPRLRTVDDPVVSVEWWLSAVAMNSGC